MAAKKTTDPKTRVISFRVSELQKRRSRPIRNLSERFRRFLDRLTRRLGDE